MTTEDQAAYQPVRIPKAAVMGAIADCDVCGTQITCGSDQMLEFVTLAADHHEQAGHHIRVRVVRA